MGDRGDNWVIEHETPTDIILRHAPAQLPKPADWHDRLLDTLATNHNIAVVGTKRVNQNENANQLHSMGEFVVHPKSFHHHGRGVPVDAYHFPEIVDCISGGIVAITRDIFDQYYQLLTTLGDLGMIALCLKARRDHRGVVCIPDVIVQDSSSPLPTAEQTAAFETMFGFEWNVADLDVIREQHIGTGLLWNARFFGRPIHYTKYESRPMLHWQSYRDVPVYRSRADAIVEFIRAEVRSSAKTKGDTNNPSDTAVSPVTHSSPSNVPSPPRVLDFGCGDGLFTHLLAKAGLSAKGIDIENAAIRQANEATAAETYAHQPPQFFLSNGGELPFDDASFDCIAMLDVIEHLPNPVGMVRELRKKLRPGGKLIVATPEWQFNAWSDPIFHVCEYTHDELAHQLTGCGFAVEKTARIGKPYRDLLAVAVKPEV